MNISMDLNAFPLREDDEEEIFGAQDEEEISHIEAAVETLRREREEILQGLKRDFPDEGPKQPRRKPIINTRFYDTTKLPPGWLDFPAAGNCIIPSKVPLGEAFRYIVPGKSSWPELVGYSGESAAKIIQRQNPTVKAILVPIEYAVTMNFSRNRVRVWINTDGKVHETPRIG